MPKREDYRGRSGYRDGNIQASFGSGQYFHTTRFSPVVERSLPNRILPITCVAKREGGNRLGGE